METWNEQLRCVHLHDRWLHLGRQNQLVCLHWPCKQSAFTLSLACLQITCSFVEDNARNCLRRISEALQATTSSKGTCGSWGLQSMVESIHRACVLGRQKMLLVSSGNIPRIASHPAPLAGSINEEPLQWTWQERGSPTGLYGYPSHQGLVPCVLPFALLLPLFLSCLNSQSPSERHHACFLYSDSFQRCQYVSPWMLLCTLE